MITIQSSRVGTIEVKEDRVIHFPEGLVGFEELKRFIIADDPNDISMPFKWLIPLENPEVIFLVTEPGIFFSDYAFDLTEEHQEFLGARSEDDVSVISMLTIPSDPSKITANLKAPLVINWRTMVGRQILLSQATTYQTKHYIFIQKTTDANVQANASQTQTTAAASAVLAAQANANTTEATTTRSVS